MRKSMPPTWQLQDAKNQLSELVRRVLSEGPQTITVRGRKVAVVVSVDEYEQQMKKPKHLVEIMDESPLKGSGINISRSREAIRKPRFKAA
jgi:prevent-host-death family protein